MAKRVARFPTVRLRRLRTFGLAPLVRETRLAPGDFVLPLFVRPGKGERRPIASMPGQFQLSCDELAREAKDLAKRGLRAVILFGIPAKKDARGSGAYARNGIVQQAVKAVRDAAPELGVITDVCLCEYTDHGHCGLLDGTGISNDRTLPVLAQTARSHVEAGANVVAPSGMMDGAVAAIRRAVGDATPIIAYAAKFASAFYGPFRDAAESPPKFGDRTTYQMNPANGREAMREIEEDLAEGADVVMVKPALAYLDVIRAARQRFDAPMAAYNVSGEYAMVKAAVKSGWLDERKVVLEILTSIRRAGADFVFTYHAKDAAGWL